jgi:hypothetical protein
MSGSLWMTMPGVAQTPAWKFAEGDRLAIRIDQATTVQTVVDRRVVDRSNQTRLEIDWLVERLEGENAVIRQTIRRVVTELTMPGEDGPKTVNYDSDVERHRGDAKRLASSFSKIVGQPVHITLTPQGRITGVEIPESTLESLRQMPGSMQGRQMFEAESLRQMFAQAGMQLPGPDEGPAWETTREFSIGTPQTFEMTTRYTIEDPQTEPLEIRFTGELQLLDSQPQRPPGIEFENIEISGQATSGTILFDVQAGNCRSSQSTTMLKTRTSYRDMEVVATVNSQVTMDVTRQTP